jgi:phospholipase/carboxylesterase
VGREIVELLHSRVRPAAGEPEGALVLFHGRGTDENDLFPLLDALDSELRLLGVTPRGPLQLPPGGNHWYVIRELGYPDRETFMASHERASAWLEGLDVPSELMVLGGFSQGAVMSYALGLGADRPRPAAIIWGRAAKEELEAAGADVLYRESPLPHTVDPGFLAELQPWLRAAISSRSAAER